MQKILVTGTGIVSPIGSGKQDIWDALERGASGIGALPGFSFPSEICCGEIRDFDLSDYVQDKRFRRTAPVSQYALASISLALADAGLSGAGEATALLMGVTHGAVGYTVDFHRELIENGPDAVSPIYFSDSVLNAPAGNASVCFGLRNSVHTVLGGPEAAIKSLIIAGNMLDCGEIERAVVACAEELNELSLSYYTKMGFSAISEGACAIIIERQEGAPRSTPCCCISGMGSECNTSDPDAAINKSLESSISMAGISASDIDLIVSGGGTDAGFFPQGTPTACITPLMGNAFAVTPLWEIALSAMAIIRGSIPLPLMSRGAKPPARLNNVMICVADGSGSAASVVLSRYE